jgi:ABC-type nitrate/sulfonate/bicarbonate transport system permease component
MTRPRPRRRSRSPGAPSSNLMLGALGLLGLAATLEIVPRLGLVAPAYLPPFSAMVAALSRLARTAAFWHAFLDTVKGWGYGLAISVVAGVGVGMVIGSVRFLREATASTIEFLRPIPSVALIPVAVLLYGSGIRSTLLLVVYASFWQVLLQVLRGIQDVDPVARDTALSYRLGPWARLRHLVWPTGLPYIMTGVRLAASVALILAITAELVIGSPGLGKEMMLARSGNAVAEVYALLIVIGLLGVVVNLGFRALERRALAWHLSVRTEIAT